MKLTLKEAQERVQKIAALTGKAREDAIAELKSAEIFDEQNQPVTLELKFEPEKTEPEKKQVDPTPEPEKIDVAAVAKKAAEDAIAAYAKTHQPKSIHNFIITGATSKGVEPIPSWAKRRGAVKNFKRAEVEGRTPEERAFRFGVWALATIRRSLPGQFGRAFGKCDEMYEEYYSKAVHQEGSDSLGGFLVPEEFGTDLIDLREQYGVARRLLKVVPMSSDTRTDPRRATGLTPYFVAENAAITESNKTWDNVRLVAKSLAVITRMSNELSEDAVISIGDDLAGEIAYAFANKEDECAFNGDGTNTYGGIQGIRDRLTSVDGAGTDAAGLEAQATGSTWGAIVLADFENVIAQLPQYADTPNACWVCHRAFYWNVMKRLELAAGGATAMETSSGGDRRPRPLFLGYPVEISQVYPSATATLTVACTFGDHALAASFGDRSGVSIAFSEHANVNSQSVFERNQIAVRGTERFDVNVHDVGTTSVNGPVVGLRTAS